MRSRRQRQVALLAEDGSVAGVGVQNLGKPVRHHDLLLVFGCGALSPTQPHRVGFVTPAVRESKLPQSLDRRKRSDPWVRMRFILDICSRIRRSREIWDALPMCLLRARYALR
jgi:hypothetical protein